MYFSRNPQAVLLKFIVLYLYHTAQHFVHTTGPVLNILATPIETAANIVTAAAHPCAALYPPSLCSIAPPNGGPVNPAKLATLNAIPILVPTLFSFGVIAVKPVGMRHWNPALAMPYSVVKM